MKRSSIFKACELLYATYNLPMVCFGPEGDIQKMYCTYPGYSGIFAAMAAQMPEGKSVSLLSGVAGLYGAIRVRERDLLVLTGPFLNKPLTDELLDSLIHTHALPWTEKGQLKQFLLTLPKYSLNRFLNFLALLQLAFNGEQVSAMDYLKGSAPALQQDVGKKHTDKVLEENPQAHGTYQFEQQLLSYVSAGDVAGLTAFFDQVASVQPLIEGKVADDTLRQSKNIFIGLICMVGKVGAIRGNLDIEQTYQLIDVYTQECERLSSVREVGELRYTAIMDFTRRVAEQKHPDAYSAQVYAALQYIKTHTNQPITASDVVAHVGKSRSVFMEQFKKETGETIGRYIIKAKLQEAKLLLAYSGRSLADISSFLYFSSQSHFQNQFKKEFGITPLQYRRKRQK